MRAFITELKRRRVIKVALLYVIGAWLIMQIVDVMFPALHLPKWSITLVAALQIIGFPIMLVLAWVFDITEDGIRRTGEQFVPESASTGLSRRMDQFIVAGLVVAIGLLLYQAYTGGKDSVSNDAGLELPAGTATPEVTQSLDPTKDEVPVQALPRAAEDGKVRSVAILPFLNLSDDPANEFFCDGISEELLNVLAAMPELRVPSRTSSFAFKGEHRDVAEIAQALEVDYVVEGSVRKAGNQVRITAQLIDVHSDSHLWSQTFDRELSDIFAVQDEIARGIADVLRLKLDLGIGIPLVDVKTTNMQAYELYLRGRQVWRLRRREALLVAEKLLQRAVGLDSSFAHAWADLAVVYMVQSSQSDRVSADIVRQAELAANQALRLNDSLGSPRAVLAAIASGKRRYAEAETLFREALQLEPVDATSRLWYATLLSGVGRTKEAGEHFRAAVELEPLSGVGLHWLGAHEFQQGNYPAALQNAERAVELGYEPAHLLAFEALARMGDLDRAEMQLSVGTALNGLDAAFVPVLMAALRDPSGQAVGDAAKAIESSLSRPDQLRMLPLLPLPIDPAARLTALDGSLFFTSLPILWDQAILGGPQTPASSAMLKELALLSYWEESRLWPDHCSPSDVGDSCRPGTLANP